MNTFETGNKLRELAKMEGVPEACVTGIIEAVGNVDLLIQDYKKIVAERDKEVVRADKNGDYFAAVTVELAAEKTAPTYRHCPGLLPQNGL